MARKKKPAQRHPISVEHNGKTYEANYYVESGVVIVEAVSKHGTIARNQAIGGGSMARMLLNRNDRRGPGARVTVAVSRFDSALSLGTGIRACRDSSSR